MSAKQQNKILKSLFDNSNSVRQIDCNVVRTMSLLILCRVQINLNVSF